MKTSLLTSAVLCSLASGHSWLECTNYKIDQPGDQEYWNAAKCSGFARCGTPQVSAGFGVDTGFDYRPRSGLDACQCSRSSSSAYSAQAPMATYHAGQRVCLAYPSKNHVAGSQNQYIPDHGLRIYRTARDATTDPAFRQWPVEYQHLNGEHQNGVVDYKGFQNCPKFDENNDKSLCTVCFHLENHIQPGQYSFYWEWNFNGPDDSYASCWEAQVEAKSSTTMPPPVKSTNNNSVTTTGSKKSIDFKSEKGQLWANGQPFMIKGASWFGFEETNHIVHGLWGSLSIDFALDFLSQNDFNAVRIPYAVNAILSNPVLQDGDVFSEPSLKGKRMLEAMDLVIEKAAERNLMIMLDAHRLRPEAGISDLWYDEITTEADAIQAWTVLAQRYCGQWNVFAADIKNEPHGIAEWGTGSDKDWRLGAERMGNAVLKQCPRWLIFVEGVEKNIVGDTSKENGWWGGKLQGVKLNPVRLSDPSKLVYSPHVYGPSVFMKPSFANDSFPENMVSIWEADFGHVPSLSDKAVVIGEWGGHFTQKDEAWQRRVQSYMVEKGLGHFYWTLNPNSGDTGGLLMDDWKTPVQSKLDLLKSCASTKIASL